MNWIDMWSRIRQWAYPAVLRIDVPDAGTWSTTLADLLSEPEAPDESLPSPPSIPDDLALSLGNAHFWIDRQVRQLTKQGQSKSQVRIIERYLQRLEVTMKDHDIHCVDVEGHVVDEGRRDFEPIGEAEIRPGLRHPTVIRCERPAIRVGNRLLQVARGTVARSPSEPISAEE